MDHEPLGERRCKSGQPILCHFFQVDGSGYETVQSIQQQAMYPKMLLLLGALSLVATSEDKEQ